MKQRSTSFIEGNVSLPAGKDRRASVQQAMVSDPASHLSAHEAEIALYRHALEKSREELQAFAYSVSHDLRAPIRAIEGFSKILMDDFSGELSEEAREFLEHIIDNTQQLSSQMEDLLKYYRLGKAALHKVILNPGEVFREALEDHKVCPGTEVIIGQLRPVTADRGQLKQAFSHLIGNAIKFTKDVPNPRIELGSSGDQNSTSVFLKDNGIGFEMQYSNRLFQVFQKLHNPSDFPGNGIGLAMVKRIVEAHGGCVSVESTPNVGSTFYMSFPEVPSPESFIAPVACENSQKTA